MSSKLEISKNNKLRFGFGNNWKEYEQLIDHENVEKAIKSLKFFLDVENLQDKSFVDVGSGSGLFSYAAHLMGAKKIISFDYDINSVETTLKMHLKAGSPTNWIVEQGSALDTSYLSNLGQFDIVYSWGVLHHTSDMWNAISYTTNMVKSGGIYYIAIYNNVEGRLGSKFWENIKIKYNSGGFIAKKIIEYLYILVYFIIAPLLRFKNPFKMMRDYGMARGMNWRKDVTDWVGGYPYEYASPGELFTYMKEKHSDFELVKLKSVGNIGCNTFVFKKIV